MTRSRCGAGWVVALVLLPGALVAQRPASLSGRVVDAATGAPLAGVELAAVDRLAQTGPEGSFRWTAVPPGRLTLVARRIGYRPDTVAVEIIPGLDRTLVLSLSPVAIAVAPITIAGLPAGTAEISGTELRARGGDLATALDGWAGISVRRSSTASAAPQVRGSAPEEVLVRLDGIPLNDPLTGRADLSRVPVADVAQVALRAGAQTPRTGGRALAGVIDISTRPHQDAAVTTGGGSFGAWELRGSGEVLGIGLSAGISRLPDDFPAFDRTGAPATRFNAGGTTWEGILRTGGEGDRIGATLRWAGADRGLPGNVTNPSSTGRSRDHSIVATVRGEGPLSWAVTGEEVRTRSWDPSAPPRGTGYDNTSGSTGAAAQLSYRYPLAVGALAGTVTGGLDGRYDAFSGNIVAPGAEFGRVGAHLGGDLAVGAWSFSPVVRLDGWSAHRGGLVTGRLDAEWRRGGTSVMMGIGSGVTPPVPFDLLFRQGVGVALNPDLRPERVRWEVSAGVRHEGRWAGVPGSVTLNGYLGRVDDLVVWAAGPNFIWSPRNVDVRRGGGELELELHPSPDWSLDGGVALSIVNYADPPYYPVAYRPRDTERLALHWTPGAWRFDLGWHRLGARPQFNDGNWNLAPIGLLDAGIERAIGRALLLRLDGRDLTDRRPEYVAGMPLPGRSFFLTLTWRVS